MSDPSDPVAFLAMVVLISLSGVIMPGPLFATTVARGFQDPRAGLKITAGHAVVEIPLIIAIFFGLETVLKDRLVFALIGIIGGIFLLYMGISMFRIKLEEGGRGESRYGSFTAGIILTAANPYFLLWWATVGASLVVIAMVYGPLILALFILAHEACDLSWNLFLSYTVNRSKKVWTGNRYRIIYGVSGSILVFFALYFMASSLSNLLG